MAFGWAIKLDSPFDVSHEKRGYVKMMSRYAMLRAVFKGKDASLQSICRELKRG
ncbi:MAG: hypothetical protein ACM3SR_07585 [Ignavibacteriales bacterium]